MNATESLEALAKAWTETPTDTATAYAYADCLMEAGRLDEAEAVQKSVEVPSGESWRTVWRKGFAPQFSLECLTAMREALATDDPRLLQGATCSPPPIQCVQDWPVEAGDIFAIGTWLGEGTTTVAEAEEFFARACFDCDQILADPAGCRWFLNWFDETPRDEMRTQLLPEVKRAIALLKARA